MKKRISFFRVAKVTYLFATGLIMAVMLLFTPTFSKFEKTGAWNLPVVTQDRKYVGYVSKSKIFSAYRSQLKEVSHE